MKNFQIIILIVFIAGAVFGVLVLSGMIFLGTYSTWEVSTGVFPLLRDLTAVSEKTTRNCQNNHIPPRGRVPKTPHWHIDRRFL